jgi:hypothetical protein
VTSWINLHDLCGALAGFLDRVNNGQPLKIGGRRAAGTNNLIVLTILRITFSHRKQSMPFPVRGMDFWTL